MNASTNKAYSIRVLQFSLLGFMNFTGCVSLLIDPQFEGEGGEPATGSIEIDHLVQPPPQSGVSSHPQLNPTRDMMLEPDMLVPESDMLTLELDMSLEPDMFMPEPDMLVAEPDMLVSEPDMFVPDCDRCLGQYLSCRALCMNKFDSLSNGNGYQGGDCVSNGGRDQATCCECSEPMPFKACSRCLGGASSCVQACGGQANSYCQTPFSENLGDCCYCQP